MSPRRTSGPRTRPTTARQPLPAGVGRFAATAVLHDFRGLDVSQCVECFGWRDDPRHPLVGGPVVGR